MSRFGKFVRTAAFAAVAAVGATPAFAQVPTVIPVVPDEANYAPLPDISDVLTPESVLPASHRNRTSTVSNCGPVPCCPPGQVPSTATPPMTMGMGTDPGTMPVDDGASFTSGRGRGAGAGPTSSLGGYLDNALPVTMFRIRYDSAYGSNRPDRAEFFYPKCGCFGTPDAKGPRNPENDLDFQELTPYFEYAVTDRFSAFVGIPVRFVNMQKNADTGGLGDVFFGAKYAVVLNERRAVTLQLRVITPTGQERDGLGTGNWWVEPGLLYLEQFTQRWQLFGQFKAQLYTDPQSDFTGNVLNYGIGSSYVVHQGCWGYVAPVVEFVGWTVTGGRELTEVGDRSAYGATIVNGKVGVRVGFGQPNNFNISKSDLYVGYGRALTGEVWYKDMFRLEYRRFF